MLPYLAQGAALAIEDAVTLAACLVELPRDPSTAFRNYEALRRPRAARVQSLARRYGWLYHLRGPLRVARNLVLERRREARALQRFDWLYRDPRPSKRDNQAARLRWISTAAPASADSSEPTSTASLIMDSCSASANASKPMKRLMVKPMPHNNATP